MKPSISHFPSSPFPFPSSLFSPQPILFRSSSSTFSLPHSISHFLYPTYPSSQLCAAMSFNCPDVSRFTRDVKAKRKTAISFEPDPDISMIAAHWSSKNIYSLYKGWFVNLSVTLSCVDLSNNYLQELPDELFNSLCVLEELDVSNNKLICLPDLNFAECHTRYG